MTCEDVEVGLAALTVGDAGSGDLHVLRAHLRDCPECRATAAANSRIAALLAQSVDLVEPPPSLRSRILAQVHAEAAGQARAAAPRVPLWRRLWERVPTGRGVTAAGGGAILALGAALALAVTILRPTTVTAPSPTAYTVASCGTSVQPTACGTLTVDPAAGHAVLSVRGLADLPVVNSRATATYEVWLITRDRQPTPAGFLDRGAPGGTWTATIAGDMSRYVAVWLTVEPDGGSATPTGADILAIPLGQSA